MRVTRFNSAGRVHMQFCMTPEETLALAQDLLEQVKTLEQKRGLRAWSDAQSG